MRENSDPKEMLDEFSAGQQVEDGTPQRRALHRLAQRLQRLRQGGEQLADLGDELGTDQPGRPCQQHDQRENHQRERLSRAQARVLAHLPRAPAQQHGKIGPEEAGQQNVERDPDGEREADGDGDDRHAANEEHSPVRGG